MFRPVCKVFWPCLCFGLCLAAVQPAHAQFDRGQRGRGGFNQSQLLGELARESIQQELKLTEEQLAAIEEIREAQSSNPEDMAAAFAALRDAESDEERAAIQAEMQAMREQREAAIRDEVAKVLDAGQMTRLDQVVLHRTGLAALSQSATAEKLGLTAEQVDEIRSLAEDRQSAVRELGFGATQEERAAVQQEWDDQILAVLSDAQRQQWTDMLGPAPPADPEGESRFSRRGDREDRGGRDGDGPPAQESPATSVTTSDGPPESSFEPTDPAEAGKMSFAFRQAPWTEVLRDFARRAGLTLELNATPPGTFEYYDQSTYTPMEALDIINGALLQRGYVLVRRDNFLVCVNIDNGPPPNLIPYISAAELPQRGRNEMLTVVFPVKGVEDIISLAEQVQEMLGPQGKAVGVEAAGALVVTDVGANLRRVDELLNAMSALLGPNDVRFQGYPLQHITAAEAEQTLRSLLGLQLAVPNVSRGGDDRRDRDDAPSSSPFDAELLAKTQFAADTRTNQLLVTAPTIVHVLIEQAIKNIDVEATSNLAANPGDTQPYLQIYTVRSSDAGEVAKTLDVMMPGVVVNEDGRNGKIHIMATAAQHREVEDYIRRMDGVGGTQTVSVIPLSTMDPLTAVSTLQSMFVADGTTAPTIQADIIGRQVMVRGTSDQIAQVKTLLAQLGEDGTGARRGGGGNIRRFSLSGRDADSLLDVIDRAWNATEPNRIQIVPADRRSPVRSLRAPGNPAEEAAFPDEGAPTTERPEESEGPISSGESGTPARFVGFVQETDEEANSESAAESEPAGAEAAPAGEGESSQPSEDTPGVEVAPGIFVQVQGDELILMSSDEEALDRLEQMLMEALAVVPPQSTWTVFTLQTADATQAAAMLEQLIPDASVSQVTSSDGSIFGSLSNSFGSMGNSLMNATGLSTTPAGTLRIIPEPRLNALFVSGTAARVQEVSDFLEILDATDWPGTMRDRVPHMIPVQYAEVSDVYRIVRDSYRDYIEGEQSNPFGGGNMLAMMMGGRGGGRNNDDNDRQQRDIRLTVAMDEQTSNLIVSADEELYQEIKELVESLDKAALEARRTIKVVALQNASTSAVQGTLQGVMPRVKVSTSGARTSQPAGSSTSQQESSSRSGDNNSEQQQREAAERMQRFWADRMRERMQQQQQPSGDGGGGRSFFFGGGDRSGGERGGGDRDGRGR
jgi:type II secretory pathway component GspD/PulD (secretin)